MPSKKKKPKGKTPRDWFPEEKELQNAFVAQVKNRARKKGVPVGVVAELAGLSAGYMSLLLSKQRNATINTVARLAIALDCKPYELLKPTRQ